MESIKNTNFNLKDRITSPDFDSEHGPEYVDNLVEDFLNFYRSLEYIEINPVPVTSDIDTTVRFIGSHISVFKPIFLGGLKENIMMSQPCIRTRNINNLFKDTVIPAWGSSFQSIGSMSPSKTTRRSAVEMFNFLKSIGIENSEIVLRVSTQDPDLLEICRELLPENQIEIDNFPERYYRHKIGIDRVWGRNFNIALRHKEDQSLSDIGNIIVIENEEKEFGTETALGTSTILRQLYGLEHIGVVDRIFDTDFGSKLIYKFEDVIRTSLLILNEGVLPKASTNQERILRTYIRAIVYLAQKMNLDIDTLLEKINEYKTKSNILNISIDEFKSHLDQANKDILDLSQESNELSEIRNALK